MLQRGSDDEGPEEPLGDSTLYLSSNWSTGGGGCARYYDMFREIGDHTQNNGPDSPAKKVTHHE